MPSSPDSLFQQLKAFEHELDGRLAACAVYRMDAAQALSLLVSMSDVMAYQRPTSNFLDKGMEVLAPYLVAIEAGAPADLEALIDDVGFAADYFMLREYLYYAYNSPGAFDWTFAPGQVEIRFLDKSIPRQFFTSHNEEVLGSMHHFSDKSLSNALAARVGTLEEWGEVPDAETIRLLEAEANHKLTAYFTIIAPDSQIDMGGFTYAEFFAFYLLPPTEN